MTTDAALPQVAKSLFTFCKKCNADRYHRVLAHTSTSKAKIECEICKSKKTYTAPKAGATPVRKKAPGVKGVGGRRTSHADQYNTLMLNRGTETGVPFNIRTKFEVNQKIDHPKFGPGFVQSVLIDRMDVMFSDELKTLMHNKTA